MTDDGERLIPASFAAQPRWRNEGTAWLTALPALIDVAMARWRLRFDGRAMHGSNGLEVPVRRGDEALVLKLTPADTRYDDELLALRFWSGRGTVLLVDAAPELGALVLERLDTGVSAASLELAEAVPLLARAMRRLAVSLDGAAPSGATDGTASAQGIGTQRAVPHTSAIAAERAVSMPAQWRALEKPFARSILDGAVADAAVLAESRVSTAVDGDLHYAQVLAGTREPWLAVDPLLLAGDPEYDLGHILWSRLDEMAEDREIRHWRNVVVREAGLEPERAAAWARFRTVDYWLWGLSHGLTEDPLRCGRLIGALTS